LKLELKENVLTHALKCYDVPHGQLQHIARGMSSLPFVGLVDHAEGSPPYWACGVVGFRCVHPRELPLCLAGLVWFFGQ
jgi:hypothetical protein